MDSDSKTGKINDSHTKYIFQPYDYKDWLVRAERQSDPYAEFFMLYIATVTFHDEGSEYGKIVSLADRLEKIYADKVNMSSHKPALAQVNGALSDMRHYVDTNRNGREIQNLSLKILDRRAKNSDRIWTETKFCNDDQRITNALLSVQIVRHNLFHGGKRAYSLNDIEIIKRCNAILRTALRLLELR